MDDLNADTLSQALTQHGLGRLLSFAPILRGNWRQNTAVVTTIGRYVFRCQPLFEQQFQIEAEAVEFLASSGVVAVPTPYVVDASRSVFPWEYAVMPLLEGVPVDIASITPENHIALARATGELLGRLHRLEADPDGFPFLADQGTSRVDPLLKADENIKKCCFRDFLTATEAQEIKFKLRAWAEALPGTFRPSFVHGDFQINNLLVSATHPAQITALLDFSGSHFGHPAEDLSRQLCIWLDLDLGKGLSDTFQHGYLNEAGPSALKALPFYLLCERLDLWVFIKDMRVDWIDHSLSFTDWLAPYLEVARQ